MIHIDTSAVIRLLRGELPPQRVETETLAVSSIVFFELWTGVFHGGGKRERRRLETFFENVEVLDFDPAAARVAARIRSELWKKGTPIGDYDTLIGGHAIAAGLPLLTDNPEHFSRIRDLEIISWRT